MSATEGVQGTYRSLAAAIREGDLSSVIGHVTDDFRVIDLDGTEHSRSEWENSVAEQFDRATTHDVHYTIEKVVDGNDGAVAYVTGRFGGQNRDGQHFHATAQYRDRLTNDGGKWRLSERDHIKRSLLLDGDAVQISERPVMRALLQGCPDYDQ